LAIVAVETQRYQDRRRRRIHKRNSSRWQLVPGKHDWKIQARLSVTLRTKYERRYQRPRKHPASTHLRRVGMLPAGLFAVKNLRRSCKDFTFLCKETLPIRWLSQSCAYGAGGILHTVKKKEIFC